MKNLKKVLKKLNKNISLEIIRDSAHMSKCFKAINDFVNFRSKEKTNYWEGEFEYMGLQKLYRFIGVEKNEELTARLDDIAYTCFDTADDSTSIAEVVREKWIEAIKKG